MSGESVQVVVALIGVAGSVAVAYITGATFKAKVTADSTGVALLEDSIRAIEAG